MLHRTRLRIIGMAAAVAMGAAVLPGCTVTQPQDAATRASDRHSIDSQVDASLSRLYQSVPGSRELVARSKGVLVFPGVVKGSFILGAEHGRGALRVDGKTAGYFSTTAGSIGFQAGAQSKDVIYVFTTAEALNKFRNSNGWTAGADANVAIAKLGANGTIDTRTAMEPVIAFVLTNVGLEAGVSVEGAKISRLAL